MGILGQTFSKWHQSYLAQNLLAGFIATLGMTLLVYGGPYFGLPNLDFAAMLGSLLARESPLLFSGVWWIGMVWHFINGTLIFPMLYLSLFIPLVGREHPVRSAVLWSIALWMGAQFVLMPAVGVGFFSESGSQPFRLAAGFLLAHLIYGGILGAMTMPRVREVLELRQDMAA
jgi:hypothetical protein